MTYLSWLLIWLGTIWGLRVNLDNSKLIPMGSVDYMEELALELGYKVETLLSTYLGPPSSAPFKSMAACDGLEERIDKRLAISKRKPREGESPR